MLAPFTQNNPRYSPEQPQINPRLLETPDPLPRGVGYGVSVLCCLSLLKKKNLLERDQRERANKDRQRQGRGREWGSLGNLVI